MLHLDTFPNAIIIDRGWDQPAWFFLQSSASRYRQPRIKLHSLFSIQRKEDVG